MYPAAETTGDTISDLSNGLEISKPFIDNGSALARPKPIPADIPPDTAPEMVLFHTGSQSMEFHPEKFRPVWATMLLLKDVNAPPPIPVNIVTAALFETIPTAATAAPAIAPDANVVTPCQNPSMLSQLHATLSPPPNNAAPANITNIGLSPLSSVYFSGLLRQ